jgi:PAS domain S-box
VNQKLLNWILYVRVGKKIPTEYRISFLKDELQEPKYIISIGRDITERKKAELELHESQEKLELFFSQSLDGFFFMMLDEPIEWNEDTNKEKVMDYVFAHQRITKANDAILEQYGATREQYIGLTPNDLFKHNLKEGKKVWREFFDTGKLRVETDQEKNEWIWYAY